MRYNYNNHKKTLKLIRNSIPLTLMYFDIRPKRMLRRHLSKSRHVTSGRTTACRQRWNRVWTFDPVTRPRHWVSVLWIERLFWRRCATSECFLPKVSGLRSIHRDHAWKYRMHRIPQIPTWRILSTKKQQQSSACKNYINRVRHWVCHIDPWPDPAKIVDPE